ncbi:Cysteine-rich receptor-like protein kinase 2 [Capsicum chinense]|nr:Cysteine-rich receptor-like protein kinase 2 [Capsicum chinense]
MIRMKYLRHMLGFSNYKRRLNISGGGTYRLLKDCASPSNMKKKKIDRIESQPKSKSMSKSPSSSHRITQSKSQRLLGACKDEEKNISKGKEKLKDEVLSMKQLMTSSFDLIFKALHINEGSKSTEYHSGHNVGLQNDNTHAGNPIGVNLYDNVRRNCIDVEARNKLSANLVDDVEKENVDVGDRIDTDAGDRPITGDKWSTFPNFDFLKFTPSGNKIREEENVQYMKDLVENSQEIDWSVIPDSEISKYTQPDKIGEHSVIKKAIGKIDTNIGSTSVALVATRVLVDVGSVRKNVDDTSIGDKSIVILDDTPVVPRRIRKPAAICELLYVSKFDSGCSNVKGQPTKCIDKGHSRKHIFSIKHPFTISITESFLDMKLLSSFNKFVDKSLQLNSNPVYSKSIYNLANAFDFGVVTIKIKERFYTLGYAGVPLTDSHIDVFFHYFRKKSKYTLLDSVSSFTTTDCWFNCLIQSLYSKFLGTKEVMEFQMLTRLIFGWDCGVFVAAFPEYMIEGVKIPASLDDIDSIRSRYGANNAEKPVEILHDVSLNFKYSTLEKATGSFNEANKLGKGGFGMVYKGVLEDGREIAIKRLFYNNTHRAVDFYNEVNIVSSVEHKNLTRLLGWSCSGPESLLVYEFLPTQSLDCFIFDPIKGKYLNWPRRFEIIIGMEEGLIYLHENTKTQIIYRDIKASNILLDRFHSKIADFGLSRPFQEGKSHISTAISGTFFFTGIPLASLFAEFSDYAKFEVITIDLLEFECVVDHFSKPISNRFGYSATATLAIFKFLKYVPSVKMPPPQPIDPLNEHVSHAEFRAAFQALPQEVIANAQSNTQATVPPLKENNSAAGRVHNFIRMNPPEFYGSKVGEYPQVCLDKVRKITQIMRVTEEESGELAAYRMKDVAYDWMEIFFPLEIREAKIEAFMNLRQGSMTVKEFCLRFNQLSKYAPSMIANSRAIMSKFVTGVSSYVVKECRSTMLNREIDLSRLMIHAQQIEPDKVKERERVRRNKKARSEQQGFSQSRFYGGNRP